MTPSLLATEVSAALREFIITGYETETEPFRGEFRRLVEEQQDGEAFIKGPYVSVGLPFLPGSAGRDFFSGFEADFPPYAHQEQAWQRLASDRQAANTLVATGTGSGKTECFLYPILDHCQRAASPGIKAIVIYPMNALATDQARRFAEVIHRRSALKGLRVGLFVGGDDHGSKVMSADRVITDKETLRNDPPDVLLTNYKMLDYLLMRPKDQKLWAHNGPDTLRYLVVDELHTFDGAQGTDLSLLIRRLRARFDMVPEQLICVGTSATLGGEDSIQGLLEYASDIFSSSFRRDSVIAEQRMSDTDFLDSIIYLQLNRDLGPEDLTQALQQGLDAYLHMAYTLFFGKEPAQPLDTLDGRIRLGKELKQHGQVANLLRELGRGRKTPTFRELVQRFTPLIPEKFERRPEQVVVALLSLLAHARDTSGSALVQLRVQLWCRELRRIVGVLREPESVSDEERHSGEENRDRPSQPLLYFGDDQPSRDRREIRLPLVQCRECHGTAWLTRMEQGLLTNQVVETDLVQIYSAFFSKHAQTALLMPWQGEQAQSPAGMRLEHFRVCRHCGHTAPLDEAGDCRGCRAENSALVRVSRPFQLRASSRHRVNRVVYEPDCPWCAAKSALVVFGARAASLSAVAIHQLFSSRNNDDRKLLAFSDSVQDAAHRAGFFAARTWHNNVRMALTQMLEAVEEPVPLLQLPELFERYWLNHEDRDGRLALPEYLREFMPPDKRYRSDFEFFELSGEVREPAPLLRLIRQRMLWQLLEDLGWRSQVGRSLNRLGIAALVWPLERVEQAARDWADTVDNTLGYRIGSSEALGFMIGLVQHLAAIGAFGLEDLRQYRQQAGKVYLLNLLNYAPALGPGSPRPRFPAMAQGEGYESLTHSGAPGSWYERWLACVNSEELADRKQIEQVLVAAFETLVTTGLLSEESNVRGGRLWMLNLQVLEICTDVQAAECPGYRPLPLSATHVDHWLGLPLLNAASPDLRYGKVVPVRESLYRKLFRGGDIHRVIAHEHTGLLPTSERIRVEDSFIKGDKPWSYNLLSATPTLEMGIDIGDLSSVLLCSVPPAQANYLQRIGRGGRRDGNSFVLTVANGRPHDLVFYADPARMLDSPVESPAVFLKARHVLRRQLLAYAMDCWTRSAKGANQVPPAMQPVLDAVEKTQGDRFPYTLLDFISRNMQEIWDGFASYVATELEGEDFELLREYLFGGPQYPDDHLKLYLLGRLQLVVEERRQMAATIRSLDRQLEKLRKEPQDEHTRNEITELEREVAGYRSLRIRLNKRETLNFFTDEGLLPNYAFPEEGATLHSIIFRSEKLSGDAVERELIRREYEYQRPAQAALTELAPESVFYAGNRKVEISRVETARGRNIQDWRFCPRCHYSAPADDPRAGFSDKNCPRCHTRQWADESARTKMLKMTQVYAFTRAKDAQLDDRSDDREPVFFNRQMLIDFNPSDIRITWVMEGRDSPFGFEFIRSANFLEVNFGRRENEEIVFEVAGERLQRAGFPICRECGSVQSRRAAMGKTEAAHLKNCSYVRGPKKRADGREDTGIENCLYLYRQFSSEALRILLPRLSTGGTEAQVNSFVAALQLGLKRRFGGKVDHLRVAYQSEPMGETDERRHFIVLYDSVPGGTGYLHELLSRAENMQSVFRMAYEVMKNCDCYDYTMDGCYRCLLEYRNAYSMESTRKSLAMEMLADIVEGEHSWVQNEDSLSTLAGNPWVDSELEARFPEALARFSGADAVGGKKVRVSQDVVRGKHGYRLIIGDLAYDMEPQVDLGAAEGVQFASRPDFVLWPVRSGMTPVAVFLDGYRFHANSVSEDLIKRQSLMHAGFAVWSLNWYDINRLVGDKAMEVPQLVGMTSSEQNHTAIAKLAQVAGMNNHVEHLNKTSFDLLMDFLAGQNVQALACQALLFVFQCMPAKVFTDAAVKRQVLENLNGLPAAFTDLCPAQVALAGSVQLWEEESGSVVRLDVLTASELLKTGDPAQAMVSLSYEPHRTCEDTARYQWQKLWALVNFLQFLPAFYAWTPDSKNNGAAAGLLWPAREEVLPPSLSEPQWFKYLDETLAMQLRNFDIAWPEEGLVGEAVVNENGEVVGEAELLFSDVQVAFLLEDIPDQLVARPYLEAAGWRVFINIEALVAEIKDIVSGA
ncbi:DEAD/DEAH box helicase [Microbulbifer thermotolerans]|uniref:DEAD/DEAH box helicase n=1 Tax=Microbulbifer thermotolerans TaxID=252514 RepID=UPI002248F957|nr:DEAD/DEAH box helicase [Microbulbifer thermotolerans]MCX2779242.1 DEAD/DEAH box helicase [Microbulbifer thermotolerans]MCX2803666.1 DEAD/DEAH box helicase [Microbulbifer thermotolerans]MCX2830429.1 DEAD/DEAH box helicase [Microbulbifer thermotolerans]